MRSDTVGIDLTGRTQRVWQFETHGVVRIGEIARLTDRHRAPRDTASGAAVGDCSVGNDFGTIVVAGTAVPRRRIHATQGAEVFINVTIAIIVFVVAGFVSRRPSRANQTGRRKTHLRAAASDSAHRPRTLRSHEVVDGPVAIVIGPVARFFQRGRRHTASETTVDLARLIAGATAKLVRGPSAALLQAHGVWNTVTGSPLRSALFDSARERAAFIEVGAPGEGAIAPTKPPTSQIKTRIGP